MPGGTRKKQETPRAEDYLETVYHLLEDKGYANTVDISDKLEVTPPTVSSMVGKLKSRGYLLHEPYRGMKLTESGEKMSSVRHPPPQDNLRVPVDDRRGRQGRLRGHRGDGTPRAADDDLPHREARRIPPQEPGRPGRNQEVRLEVVWSPVLLADSARDERILSVRPQIRNPRMLNDGTSLSSAPRTGL